mmetsp:Transcript_52770/g.153480  ORF Transcript_52770/g.153480 Transcript_52770/m.153480 type:complete len:103 (+) Transcript_52770:1404-1712(+)
MSSAKLESTLRLCFDRDNSCPHCARVRTAEATNVVISIPAFGRRCPDFLRLVCWQCRQASPQAAHHVQPSGTVLSCTPFCPQPDGDGVDQRKESFLHKHACA